jgi:hypothetical protein
MSAMAADRYHTRSGWAVEVIQLTGTPNQHDGAWIRLTHHGFHVADVRDPAELERWIALAELRHDALIMSRSRCPPLHPV